MKSFQIIIAILFLQTWIADAQSVTTIRRMSAYDSLTVPTLATDYVLLNHSFNGHDSTRKCSLQQIYDGNGASLQDVITNNPNLSTNNAINSAGHTLSIDSLGGFSVSVISGGFSSIGSSEGVATSVYSYEPNSGQESIISYSSQPAQLELNANVNSNATYNEIIIDTVGVRIAGETNSVGYGYTLPISTGTSNQVLTTDGAGQTSWQSNTPALDSTTIDALTPVTGQTVFCTNCTGNGNTGKLETWTGSLWKRWAAE